VFDAAAFHSPRGKGSPDERLGVTGHQTRQPLGDGERIPMLPGLGVNLPAKFEDIGMCAMCRINFFECFKRNDVITEFEPAFRFANVPLIFLPMIQGSSNTR
jgi:hypothetical protein